MLVEAQIKENIKAPRHWPLYVTVEFPAQKANNAENVSIWWRHHDSDKRRQIKQLAEITLYPLSQDWVEYLTFRTAQTN